MANSILWGDASGNPPVIDEISNSSTAAAAVTYCDIDGGYPGTGNISTDPFFAEPAAGDCHLTFQSICRDAGDNSLVGLPADDFEGDRRDGLIDMGADEFHKHLYRIGDVTSGGNLSVKVIGTPGTPSVKLFMGSGIQDPPQLTQYGDLYLFPPYTPFSLGSISSNGVLVVSGAVPGSWIPGEQFPFQALVESELTNLMVLVVQ